MKIIRNPIKQAKRQIYILKKYLSASVITIWINGYVFLLTKTTVLLQVLYDIDDIERKIHTTEKNKLTPDTIDSIKQALKHWTYKNDRPFQWKRAVNLYIATGLKNQYRYIFPIFSTVQKPFRSLSGKPKENTAIYLYGRQNLNIPKPFAPAPPLLGRNRSEPA